MGCCCTKHTESDQDDDQKCDNEHPIDTFVPRPSKITDFPQDDIVEQLLDQWKVDMYSSNKYLYKIPDSRIRDQRAIIKKQLQSSSTRIV